MLQQRAQHLLLIVHELVERLHIVVHLHHKVGEVLCAVELPPLLQPLLEEALAILRALGAV